MPEGQALQLSSREKLQTPDMLILQRQYENDSRFSAMKMGDLIYLLIPRVP